VQNSDHAFWQRSVAELLLPHVIYVTKHYDTSPVGELLKLYIDL